MYNICIPYVFISFYPCVQQCNHYLKQGTEYFHHTRSSLVTLLSSHLTPLPDYCRHRLALPVHMQNSYECNPIVFIILFPSLNKHCFWKFIHIVVCLESSFILLPHSILLNKNTVNLSIFTRQWMFGLFLIWTYYE